MRYPVTLFLFLVSKLLTGANSCVEWPVVDWGLRSWAAGGRLLALLASRHSRKREVTYLSDRNT